SSAEKELKEIEKKEEKGEFLKVEIDLRKSAIAESGKLIVRKVTTGAFLALMNLMTKEDYLNHLAKNFKEKNE
ncbi:hypothetical protein N9A72_00455, partial [bacterium]|nr:hypothetical protein [bacterium]